ncbi:MAG TPA: alanyl-tRNA editing protein, partial [candidate division Zixibacteria bacterium]|nr:alanyl-tRNA editing protein [candidate division Zixibacteria bacterium]
MPSLENEKTELLFWKDPYLVEFEAKIIEKAEKGLVLDKTAFYPEGGGQFSDEGYFLLPNNEKIQIEKTEKINGKIIHVITRKDLLKIEIGIKIKGKINWEKRYNIMKAHTSQHILSAMIVKNANIETTKAIISDEDVIIHLAKKIPNELLKKSIIETNTLLLTGISIESNFFTKDNLSKHIKGKLRGNIDNISTENLRVVSVKGVDHSLCGGTHVKNTSEIGFLAVVDFKGDIIRYKFGEHAIDFNATLNVETISTAKLLASKSE